MVFFVLYLQYCIGPNIYIQHVIRQGQSWRCAGTIHPSCRRPGYIVSHTQRGVQCIMDAPQQTKYNMWINAKKTKVMRIPGRKGRKMRIIMVNGKELESVTQFCYLGSMVTEDCRSECEVRRRIALAKEAFNMKKDLICGSLGGLTMRFFQLKKRTNQSIWVQYGVVWKRDMYIAEEKRIEASEMWIWHRTLEISWTKHKKNDKVLRRVETKR